MLKVTLVIKQGRMKGLSCGTDRDKEQSAALNRSTTPVAAKAQGDTRTLFSAATPPLCHNPHGSATHLD